ncbi:methyltransferase [Actinoallomurus rhizosphaericola]|uniref:methyltransferase n=1 Tax=Actinoallomurus rhizosphaericola TaxID=2952536 RepID=UPI002092AA31|nr:methyltransferase [Actinoallomurus rhizosphaericola]MCO5996957.1 methyltransferase domain-containing protein [Actinoallomurus rhizosphaericola]
MGSTDQDAATTTAGGTAAGSSGRPAPARLMQTVMHALAAKTVYAAAELGLADLLDDGPLTTAELAERTGAHGPSLRRLLLALAGMGLVTQTATDRFELAEAGRPLRKDAPDSIRELVRMMCGPAVWRSWDELVPSVRTGEPAWDLAHGVSWIEYYAREPEEAATFNRAMAEHTRDAAPGILAAADLSRFGTVVDVGGGDGTLLSHVLRAHPGVRGVVFDVPTGLAATATTLAEAGVAARCEVVSGDFFVSVPAGADAYLLKQILHDWDDERATAILRNVRAAVPPGGRLFVIERAVPERVTPGDPAEIRDLLLDLHMLVATGGRERTEREFERLLDAAGFEQVRLTALPRFDFRVIEATPA